MQERERRVPRILEYGISRLREASLEPNQLGQKSSKLNQPRDERCLTSPRPSFELPEALGRPVDRSTT